MIKPGIPKGTRDFSPAEVKKREYLFSTIREVFHLYGFEPLETPAMENLTTLTGKYGDEGDQLIFKILNSGDYLNKVDVEEETLRNTLDFPGRTQGAAVPSSLLINQRALTEKIAEKALRYDLTVPFARYVVQHQHEINFPFRRYQIQPVWRADRPQKGRYREFYQCDVDVIGTDSLQCEAELLSIIDRVFQKLGLKVLVKLNNRKILQGIAEEAGLNEHFMDFTIAIDKLEKIGMEKVKAELEGKGIAPANIERAFSYFDKDLVNPSEPFANELLNKGSEELRTVLEKANLSVNTKVEIDLTLARGLNYYTGTIIEVKSDDSDFTPTICAGGRYDDLTGIFGMKGMSGVGISFGADRIYDVLEAAGKFPAGASPSSKIMFVNFGETEAAYANTLAEELRSAGIATELYPDAAKMKKQMSYASNKQIPYVAIIGSEEIEKQGLMLKDLATGEQEFVAASQLLNRLAK